MITKEQKLEIFENIISGLRTKFIQSDKEQLDEQGQVNDKHTEKYRRLPLD